ncbi:MAG: hypothetical protein AB1698_15695 [Pseudomonadota bacterium]|nr:hypothetical protein [Hyphomicrobiales bacterium]
MVLARGFFVISVLAVLSSASAGFVMPPAQGGQGPSPQPVLEQGQPTSTPDRYFGPSQFA